MAERQALWWSINLRLYWQLECLGGAHSRLHRSFPALMSPIGSDAGMLARANVPVRLGAAAPSGNLGVTASVTAGGTYISLDSGTITINNGAYAGNFVVNILPAAVGLSSDVAATITLTAPTGWMLGAQSVHTINIISSGAEIAKTGFVEATSEIVEGLGGAFSIRGTIEVTLPSSPVANVSFILSEASTAMRSLIGDWRFEGLTADGSNWIIRFPAGATGAGLTQTFTIVVFDDGTQEPDETITLTLTDPTGSLTTGGNNFTLDSPTHIVTIPAND